MVRSDCITSFAKSILDVCSGLQRLELLRYYAPIVFIAAALAAEQRPPKLVLPPAAADQVSVCHNVTVSLELLPTITDYSFVVLKFFNLSFQP